MKNLEKIERENIEDNHIVQDFSQNESFNLFIENSETDLDYDYTKRISYGD